MMDNQKTVSQSTGQEVLNRRLHLENEDGSPGSYRDCLQKIKDTSRKANCLRPSQVASEPQEEDMKGVEAAGISYVTQGWRDGSEVKSTD
ncbi:hypothetical protein LEMLEM_LOCUS13842 [Lemmus lemmus]